MCPSCNCWYNFFWNIFFIRKWQTNSLWVTGKSEDLLKESGSCFNISKSHTTKSFSLKKPEMNGSKSWNQNSLRRTQPLTCRTFWTVTRSSLKLQPFLFTFATKPIEQTYLDKLPMIRCKSLQLSESTKTCTKRLLVTFTVKRLTNKWKKMLTTDWKVVWQN